MTAIGTAVRMPPADRGMLRMPAAGVTPDGGRLPTESARNPYANALIALAWLALGAGALTLDWLSSDGGRIYATVTLSGLATLFGLWVFWRHGGRRITATGIYNFAFALFVGFGGLYQVATLPPWVSPDTLLAAVTWCYFAQVATWLLFWTRDPSPVPADTAEVNPEVMRWAARLGGCLLLVAVAISVLRDEPNILVDAAGFVGTLLIGIGLLRGPRGHRWVYCGVIIGAAFAIYLHYLFNGFGRIVLGSLAFGLLIVLAHGNRGRLVKAIVMLGTAPVLLILAKLRLQKVEQIQANIAEIENGLESVVAPLQSFATLLGYSDAGWLPLSWGHTFWAALVAPVPRSLWPEKPVGFGAELVPILSPTLVNTGHSEAALFAGEWLFNFGLPGLVLMVPVAGFALRGLDHLLARATSLRLESRLAVMYYTAAVVAAAGVLDLMWVGTSTYAGRTGARLLILATGLAVLAWRLNPGHLRHRIGATKAGTQTQRSGRQTQRSGRPAQR